MKVKAISFANSVKCGKGGNEEMFCRDDRFDIDIVDSVRVRLTEKGTGNVTWTSLFNTKWWQECDKKPSPDAKAQAPKTQKKASGVKL